MDIRFDTWNIRSSYKAGSLVTVSKYMLNLVGVQVRWEGGGTKLAEYIFSMETGMKIIN
jgi:hypothetical protein